MSRVSWKNNHIGERIIPRNVQGLCGGGELVVWWSSHQCLTVELKYRSDPGLASSFSIVKSTLCKSQEDSL